MQFMDTLKRALRVSKDLDVADVHVGTALGNVSTSYGQPKPKRRRKTKVRRTKLARARRAAKQAREAAPGGGGSGCEADFSIPFAVTKADPEQRLIFGWASVVEQDGQAIVDKQGDIIDAEDIEKAAYDFVLYARQHGNMHDQVGTGRMVESMVFTKDKQAALGIDLGKVGWWVGFKVDDDAVWKSVKDGRLPEFSIGGTGVREDIEPVVEKVSKRAVPFSTR